LLGVDGGLLCVEAAGLLGLRAAVVAADQRAVGRFPGAYRGNPRFLLVVVVQQVLRLQQGGAGLFLRSGARRPVPTLSPAAILLRATAMARTRHRIDRPQPKEVKGRWHSTARQSPTCASG
jgi:hypothetical protein